MRLRKEPSRVFTLSKTSVWLACRALGAFRCKVGLFSQGFLLRRGWFLPQTRDINGHGVPGVGAVPEMQNPEVGTRGVPGVAEMIPSAAPVIVCPAALCRGCGFDAGLPGRLPVFPARISNILALSGTFAAWLCTIIISTPCCWVCVGRRGRRTCGRRESDDSSDQSRASER